MISNKLALVALGIACVGAAGGGAYLATRQASQPASTAIAPTALPTPATAVQETEAVVGDLPRDAALNVKQFATRPVEAPESVRRRPQATQATQATATPQAGKAPRPVGPDRNAPTPALERTWPTSAGTPAQPVLVQSQPEGPVEIPRAPEPPGPVFEEVVVSADSVIGLQLDSTISSEHARVEDRVEARVVRDVRADGEIAIPAGARALGSVTFVERGGKFKERARLAVRFHTLVLADGTRLPVSTEAITRSGDAPSNSSAATFPAGAEVTARILAPVTVTIEK